MDQPDSFSNCSRHKASGLLSPSCFSVLPENDANPVWDATLPPLLKLQTQISRRPPSQRRWVRIFTLRCDHLRTPLLGIIQIRPNITKTLDGHTLKVCSLYVRERVFIPNTVGQRSGAALQVFSQLAGTARMPQPLQSNRCFVVFVPPQTPESLLANLIRHRAFLALCIPTRIPAVSSFPLQLIIICSVETEGRA